MAQNTQLNQKYKVCVKIHNHLGRTIVAVCDKSLIGKEFKDKNLQLKVKKEFYEGKGKKEEEVIKILKRFDNVNIVGKNAVKIALKAKVISKDNILYIKGVPHAQTVVL